MTFLFSKSTSIHLEFLKTYKMAASSEEKSSSSEAQDWRKKSGLSCSFFIFAALNLAMVIVGGDAAYLCPVQPMVPVYLIGKYLRVSIFCLIVICVFSFFSRRINQPLVTSDKSSGGKSFDPEI